MDGVFATDGARIDEPLEVLRMHAFHEVETETVEADLVDEPLSPHDERIAHGQARAISVVQGHIVPERVHIHLMETTELRVGEEVTGVGRIPDGVGIEIRAARADGPGDASGTMRQRKCRIR